MRFHTQINANLKVILTFKSVIFQYYKNQHTFVYFNFNKKIFFVFIGPEMLKYDIKDISRQ